MKLLDPKNCYKTTSSMKHGGFSTLKPLEISKDSGGKKKMARSQHIQKKSLCSKASANKNGRPKKLDMVFVTFGGFQK